ncbi:MAG: efflux RND transporter periplasmic adaptor subunit [Deltaproteobacteria bacterium]|jgi:RND family efflux transporter MFP subunit|nr:efflux RND transporter periplasmic adaptor subunit [Deltaproteobacteria bacterium]
MTMSQKLWAPLMIMVLSVLGAVLLVATAPSVEYKEPERAIPTVRTISAEPATIRHRVRTQGTVMPRTEADLVPEVSGRVVWIAPSLAPGGFFEKGEPLLRLERRDFELAVKRQRAAVQRAASEFEFAESELTRRQGLSDAGVASPSQLSEARRAAAVAEANLIDARAAREQAERDLERTEIRAPFDGRVRDEHVDVGQFVGRGNAVARIYATDYAEIRLPIPDHQLAFLDLPDPRRRDAVVEGEGPEVILSSIFAGRRHEWRGRLVRTEGEIDARSRMVNVVARVEEPYRSQEGDDRPPLAVGLFVEAEILGPEASDVIVVPRYAMRGDSTILVVNGENRLRTRRVQVLRIDRDDVLVQGPIGDDERICVSPVQIVVEGMVVRTVEDPAIRVSEADHS